MNMNYKDIFFRLQNGNDVRGIAVDTPDAPQTLTGGIAACICAAFAQVLAEQLGKDKKDLRIGIGHDSRVSAEEIQRGCCQGFTGTQVYLCGLASTPSMFQSTVYEESGFDASVMITASHLPFNRNGLKFFTREGGLEKAVLTKVLEKAALIAGEVGLTDACTLPEGAFADAGEKMEQDFDLVSVYCAHMRDYVCAQVQAADYAHPLAGLHIVLDAGNGAAGFFAPGILEPLGADVSGSVFLDPDGTFPNHVPNPENAAAMDAIRKATLEAGADLGVIFDCDGDRGAVVLGDGREVNRNRLIALLARIVSMTSPGSTIVTDSVTSDELADFLENRLGMKHLRFKRGYKNVINKGIELNAAGETCELAIETSGHGAFKDNYFSDDGAYISIKIICQLARMRQQGQELESLLEGFEEPGDEMELRFKILDPQPGQEQSDFKAYGARVVEDFAAFVKEQDGMTIVTPNYEGVRAGVETKDGKGWILVRQSLHDPEIPVNIESKQKGGTTAILAMVEPFFARYDRLRRK
ncbi:MAG: phosphomannomutase/phosphoglucomutase [Blautia sp.]|nr:phosphomannomutase/phosphoglucomutase [Blautia sp.]